jgi:hypothetical protein
MRAKPMTGVVTDHGEGAGWHPGDQVFKVVDMLARSSPRSAASHSPAMAGASRSGRIRPSA